MVAVAIWRSQALPRASGVLFALGFVTFLPQFFAPASLRITHGVLVAAGLGWLALVFWRTGSHSPSPDGRARQ